MIRPSTESHAGVSIDSSEREHRSAPGVAGRARPEARRRQGEALVAVGWIIAVVGVVLYCAASFATELEADLVAVMLHGAVPAARLGLLVIGAGAVFSIAGAVLTMEAMDAGGGWTGAREDEGERSGASRCER